MVPENFWNDVDGHSSLHVDDELIATIHQEGDAFYLVAIAGSVRYYYYKLDASNMEQAKKETVSLLSKVYFDEYTKLVHKGDRMLSIYDSLVWRVQRKD